MPDEITTSEGAESTATAESPVTQAETEATKVVETPATPEATDEKVAEGDDNDSSDDKGEADSDDDDSLDTLIRSFNESLPSVDELLKASPAEATTKASEEDSSPRKLFTEKWTDIKSSIEKNWETMEATDNERLLVQVLDDIAPLVDTVQRYEVDAARDELVRESQRISQMAIEAAAAINADFGLDVKPEHVIGYAQNGGIAALAALRGEPVESFFGRLSTADLRSSFELKNREQLDKLRSRKGKSSTPAAKPHRSLTGGGTREQPAPRDEREAFRQNRQAARSKAS